jgi:monovalent cation:H+ antiporter-2, CPA2 family
MPHETGLITILAAGFGLAFLLGLLATRVKLPPLVGYLVAGIVIGPFTPGFVADAGLATQLAEIGVILLMFGVGLHF